MALASRFLFKSRLTPLIYRRLFSAPKMEAVTEQLQALGINDFKPAAGSHPDENPVDIFRCHITEKLAEVTGIDPGLIYPALEFTSTVERGDLVIPVPRLRVKGTPPKELAEKWAAEFPETKYIEKVKAFGTHIQFWYKPSVLFKTVVQSILQKKEHYGESTEFMGKRAIVEFSSPNIAKPFHAGHLRSTIIGGVLANLHERMGWDVTRINYLGDWGKQFGLLAVAIERYGDEEKLVSDPINHLFEIYVKINKDKEDEAAASPDGSSETDDKARAVFKDMSDGVEDKIALWRRLRELSIARYQETYARLNIKYDFYSGESQVSQERMDEALKALLDKNLVTEDKGALLVDLTSYAKRLGRTLIRKSDGTTLYLTRDIGEAKRRQDAVGFDRMVYVAASQQDLHFAQLFKILELLGYDWAKSLVHVNFGMVQGMSTRKGTVVFLDHILDEVKEAMHQVMQKNESKYAQIEDPERVADLVGLSAVMVQDLQAKRINNYTFDWKRMLSFEGDTGPYLQYAHSRLRSMERKAQFTDKQLASANMSLLTEPIAANIARVLAAYPDTLKMAYKNLEPSTVVTYLFKLTHTVSSAYDILWVAGQEEELSKARMALYSAARQVLYNGMTLIGLTPVDRM